MAEYEENHYEDWPHFEWLGEYGNLLLISKPFFTFLQFDSDPKHFRGKEEANKNKRRKGNGWNEGKGTGDYGSPFPLHPMSSPLRPFPFPFHFTVQANPFPEAVHFLNPLLAKVVQALATKP